VTISVTISPVVVVPFSAMVTIPTAIAGRISSGIGAVCGIGASGGIGASNSAGAGNGIVNWQSHGKGAKAEKADDSELDKGMHFVWIWIDLKM